MLRKLRIVVALFVGQFCLAQTANDTIALIDAVFTQYEASNPGCQLSVSRKGKLLYSKAFGMADLERNVALTTNSIIEAGSVSKQFTAAAILLLEQQGKLSLDDDVSKYVPELPEYGSTIKLRHLIHHTSGLKDWGSIAALTGWGRGTKFYTNDDALEIIERQKQLNNKPGDEFIYSNSNFNLSAIIVLRVSGLSLADFTKKYIFEPAGMTNTQWRDDPNRIVKNRAIAYSKTETGYEINMPNEYVYGNGGLLTTTEDLLKWSDYYQNGKFGNPSLLSRQLETEPLNDGKKNNYAAGLFMSEIRGKKYINHDGATAGYRSFLGTFPDLGLTFAFLSNSAETNSGQIANKLQKIFIADVAQKNKAETKPKPQKTVTLSAKRLNEVAGLYKVKSDGGLFHLQVDGNGLVLQENGEKLKSLSSTKFASESFVFDFTGDNGVFKNLRNNNEFAFEKIQEFKVSASDLPQFEGKFSSDEAGATAIITVENDQLKIRLNANTIYTLKPNKTDAFTVDEMGGNLEFLRDSQRKVVAFKISTARARNLVFGRSE
ncbi:MAG: serine hydrolase [Flavobacterium sp.]|uniref:serine hydrolase domain-containing protein n=1 Tax=Flavobacterium sp. TaxID=239 RepID=UPI0011F82688|nr:serine hydrolase domain-containing protein [Flavobacterium sp.]RZJ66578.1 MAG: serine hydrolase [Flavobacterium sp.]